MKQLLKFTFWALIASCIIYLTSCSKKVTALYVITGTVKEIKGDTVILNTGKKFKVKTQPPAVGDTVTFTATLNRNAINSKSIKN